MESCRTFEKSSVDLSRSALPIFYQMSQCMIGVTHVPGITRLFKTIALILKELQLIAKIKNKTPKRDTCIYRHMRFVLIWHLPHDFTHDLANNFQRSSGWTSVGVH